MPGHVILAGPLTAYPAKNKPFSVKIIYWLIFSNLKLKVMMNLPCWCILKGPLSIISLSKGNVVKRYQPLIDMGS